MSIDPRQVAVTKSNALGSAGGLEVVEFDFDRGISTYRGLAGQVAFVWMSPSKKWVAALSHDWQLGVWVRATGRVAFVWDVPIGLFADNADAAFDGVGDGIER